MELVIIGLGTQETGVISDIGRLPQEVLVELEFPGQMTMCILMQIHLIHQAEPLPLIFRLLLVLTLLGQE